MISVHYFDGIISLSIWYPSKDDVATVYKNKYKNRSVESMPLQTPTLLSRKFLTPPQRA